MKGLAVFLRAVLAVLAAFFGVRKRDSALKDAKSLRPVHFVAAGVLLVVVFIFLVRAAVGFAVGA